MFFATTSYTTFQICKTKLIFERKFNFDSPFTQQKFMNTKSLRFKCHSLTPSFLDTVKLGYDELSGTVEICSLYPWHRYNGEHLCSKSFFWDHKSSHLFLNTFVFRYKRNKLIWKKSHSRKNDVTYLKQLLCRTIHFNPYL